MGGFFKNLLKALVMIFTHTLLALQSCSLGSFPRIDNIKLLYKSDIIDRGGDRWC